MPNIEDMFALNKELIKLNYGRKKVNPISNISPEINILIQNWKK